MAIVFMEGYDTRSADVLTNVYNSTMDWQSGRTGVGYSIRNHSDSSVMWCDHRLPVDLWEHYGRVYMRSEERSSNNNYYPSDAFVAVVFSSGETVTNNTIVAAIRFQTFSGDRMEMRLGTDHLSYGSISAQFITPETFLFHTWHLIEWHIKINSGNAVDLFEARVNGGPILSATTFLSANPIKSLGYYHGSDPQARWDDLKINDTTGLYDNSWCGGGRCLTLYPNANGTYSEFLGSDGNLVDNYLLVDESIPSTADYVESSVSGAKDSYNIENTSLNTGEYINAVQTVARVGGMDANSTKGVRSFIRHANTDYFDPAYTNVNTGAAYPVYRGKVHNTNPASGLQWDAVEVDALEIGIENE